MHMQEGLASFLHRQMQRNGAFVEVGEDRPTLEATRFAVETRLRSGLELGAASDVTCWVKSLWRSGGGFAPHADSVAPDLASTYYASRLLVGHSEHGFLRQNERCLVAWLEEEWNRDEQFTVDALYYLARTFSVLGLRATETLAGQWLDFLARCVDDTGAFGNMPGTPGDVEHTYCSIHVWQGLGARVSSGLSDWLRQCTHPDGWITWSPASPSRSYATLYWGSHLALLLGAAQPWERRLRLVEQTQNPDGGFGVEKSTVWQTYCAASAHLIAEIATGRRSRSELVIE